MTQYDLGKVTGEDGAKGDDGVGIASITKTSTSGLVDTYTITYTDGDTDTFTVTNGSDASVTIQTSFGSPTSDSKVPSEKLTKTELDKKISTSSTTGLMKNDGSVMTGGTGSSNWAIGNHSHSGYVSATKVTSWSSTVSDSNVPSEKLVKNSLDDKISKSSTTGLVKNDGSIDTNSYLTSSSLTNYVQKSNTSGLLKNDGTVDTSSYITSSAISGMLTSSDIADNLTTNDSTKVLSAKQGKVLNDLIGQAITYINQ